MNPVSWSKKWGFIMYTILEIKEILNLKASGLSYKEIAILKCKSSSAIKNICKTYFKQDLLQVFENPSDEIKTKIIEQYLSNLIL